MNTETVAVLTAGTLTDPYSSELTSAWVLPSGKSWTTAPSEVNVTTLAPAEPRPSSEPAQDARNSVTSGWTLYLPAGTAITSANRVRVRGTIYPVQGTPAVWGSRGVVVQAYGTAG